MTVTAAVTAYDVRSELEAAFAMACDQLVDVQLQQEAKDTPRHRTAVDDCRTRIDNVLDWYLAYFRPSPA